MHRPSFIVDVNVGKLAVWLRALGYDTVFVNPIDDGELVEIALKENRIVLTRDSGIMRRRVVTSGHLTALHIHGIDWRQQLSQVIHAFKLRGHAPFTRCVKCNSPLESCPRQQAAVSVPKLVLSTQEEFFSCPTCRRIYWQGSHWERMQSVMKGILGAPKSNKQH